MNRLEHELAELKRRVLEMGTMAESMVTPGTASRGTTRPAWSASSRTSRRSIDSRLRTIAKRSA
jgi:hypothetical protein